MSGSTSEIMKSERQIPAYVEETCLHLVGAEKHLLSFESDSFLNIIPDNNH